MLAQDVVDIANVEGVLILALLDGFPNEVIEGWVLVKEFFQDSDLHGQFG